MDVKSAFLYGVLKEKIYMQLPKGYRTAGKVARLRKCIYGLNNPPASGTHASLRYFGKFDLLYHTSTTVYSFTNLNQPSFRHMWMTSQ